MVAGLQFEVIVMMLRGRPMYGSSCTIPVIVFNWHTSPSHVPLDGSCTGYLEKGKCRTHWYHVSTYLNSHMLHLN